MAAQAIGFPVAVKIVSPDLHHKSEVGDVLVGLASAADVRLQAETKLAHVKANAPNATIDGLLVAPMVTLERATLAKPVLLAHDQVDAML